MMSQATSRPVRTLDRFFAPTKPKKTGLIERVAVVVSMTVIVTLILVDVVRSAPPDATFTQITFDAAPDTGWALPATAAVTTEVEARWAADESAQGSRPDAAH